MIQVRDVREPAPRLKRWELVSPRGWVTSWVTSLELGKEKGQLGSPNWPDSLGNLGGAGGNRTHDLLNAMNGCRRDKVLK